MRYFLYLVTFIVLSIPSAQFAAIAVLLLYSLELYFDAMNEVGGRVEGPFQQPKNKG